MKDKAVIFDFNGTLFWDSEINFQAWKRVIKIWFDREYSIDEYFILNGRTTKETLSILFDRDLSDAEVEEYSSIKADEYFKIMREQESSISLAPGVTTFIENLKSRGINVAIATSATTEYMSEYDKYFKLHQYFDKQFIIANDGNYKSKPDPEIYIKAMETLNVSPSNVVVFEDTKSGILSAYNAKVNKVFAINSPLSAVESVINLNETHRVLPDFHNINIDELFEN